MAEETMGATSEVKDGAETEVGGDEELISEFMEGGGERDKIQEETWGANWIHLLGMPEAPIYEVDTKTIKSKAAWEVSHGEKFVWDKNAKGERIRVPYTRKWLCSEHRQRAMGITFDPASPPYSLVEAKDGEVYGRVNIYPGMPDLEVCEDEVKKKKAQRRWKKLMKKLFGEHWEWVALWVAHALFRPWQKCNQAVLLTTQVQGIGKSLFADIIIKMMGELGVAIKAEKLVDRFNRVAEGKLWAFVDEMDNKWDTRESQLNDMITQIHMEIERKRYDSYKVINLLRYYMVSNSATPIRLSRGQRRVLVLNPSVTNKEARGRYGAWVRAVILPMKEQPQVLWAVREWFRDLWEGRIGLETWVGKEKGREGKAPSVWWDPGARVPETEAADELYTAGQTSSMRVADSFTDWVEERGWCVVSPEQLVGPHAKTWGEILGRVRARGGVISRLRRGQGGRRQYKVLDMKGKVPYVERLKPNGALSFRESKIELGDDEVQALSEETAKALGALLVE